MVSKEELSEVKMSHEVLFKTVAGSRLYGLSHENSDHDFYTVISKVKRVKAKYAKQTIHDGVDSMVVDFGTWLMQVEDGVPQACEAMMSQMPLIDNLPGFRQGYRFGTQVYDRYLRTIKSFAMNDEEDPNFHFKKKRHALRLACNLADIGRYGRFNPTLSSNDIEVVNYWANNCNSEEVYAKALNIVWS